MSRIARIWIRTIVCAALVGAGCLLMTPTSFAQKPYEVSFVNNTNRPLSVTVTQPEFERLGTLAPGQAMGVDFNFGEIVQIHQNRQLIKQIRITRSYTETIGRSPASVAPSTTGGTSSPSLPPGGTTGSSGPNPPGGMTPGSVDLQQEARQAAQYLNQIRANPRAFTHLHPSLGDADVQARPALVWNDALQRAAERKARWMAQTNQFEHAMNIGGQTVGMNQWMREAGYPLADSMPNTETNFENLYGEGGDNLAGIGQRVINSFMSEGKDGGHVLPTLGRGFWTPCKDIGVGIAKSPGGMTYVSLLVGVYDPFNPTAVPQGQAGTDPDPTPGNSTPAGNPVEIEVVNKSQVRVILSFTVNGGVGRAVLLGGQKTKLKADASSLISYTLPTSGASVMVTSTNNRLVIPEDTCVLQINNAGPETLRVSVQTPVFETKEGRSAYGNKETQVWALMGQSIRRAVLPKGTVISATSPSGSFTRKLNQDQETIVYPPN